VRGILRDRRTFAAVLVAVVVASTLIGWLRDGDSDNASDDEPPPGSINVSQSPSGSAEESPGDDEGPSGPAFPTAVAPSHPETDEASGLPVVELASLPPEVTETVDLIEAGGPFPYADDGETFLNSVGLLPERETGYYRAYTVETPGPAEPSNRRIVTGADGELYWTDDHYESFRRISR
jgi:ribonuclease T1